MKLKKLDFRWQTACLLFYGIITSVFIALQFYSNSSTLGSFEERNGKKSEHWMKQRILKRASIPPQKLYTVEYRYPQVGFIYEFGFHIPNRDVCPHHGEDIDLLIFVESSPNNRNARMAVRKTYGDFNNTHVKLAFILGRSQNIFIDDRIRQENQMYKDIIVSNFKDSYSNLTLKTLSIFAWVVENCYKAAFVLKTDDDVYINMKNLLISMKPLDPEGLVIMGNIFQSLHVTRKKQHKFYVPFRQFNGSRFPPYTIGLGYVISVVGVEKILSKALTTPFLRLEDAFFTGVVVRDLGFTLKHNGNIVHLSKKFCRAVTKVLIHLNRRTSYFYTMRRYEMNPSWCHSSDIKNVGEKKKKNPKSKKIKGYAHQRRKSKMVPKHKSRSK